MFLDVATIFIKSGNGGDGAVSFHTEKYVAQGGPDGGDGGDGGSIVFLAEGGSSTLVDFRYSKHFRAEDGVNGSSKNCKGRGGKDLVIKVPCGTIIKDKEGKIYADMFYEGSTFVIQRGGRGGKGNARFATSERKAPKFSQKGERTEEMQLILELKTIADVGLVGFPNVGKSTILSIVSAARPKIANYHFTTLTPNLGAVKYYDEGFVIADIPGLIEGASDGAGLGHSFLKHIERVRLIVHVVDISGSEGRDAYEDYLKINKELKAYSEKLAELPQIICANKCDLLDDETVITDFEEKVNAKVLRMSAIYNSGTEELVRTVIAKLKELPPTEPIYIEQYVEEEKDYRSFHVSIADDGAYIVEGGLIDLLSRNVVLSDYESFRYFQKQLKDKGVISALRKKGIQEGDTVRIEGIEFEYME